jgi:PTH1 family peptidyl-tRNA hydrolase
VAALRDFYKIPVERIVVVHDELDLPFGTIRLKLGGGAGGHNGLRSITQSLGSPDYHRIRFGIGRPPGRMDPMRFVLHDFSTAERRELPLLLGDAADAVETLLGEGLTGAQNAFHARPGNGSGDQTAGAAGSGPPRATESAGPDQRPGHPHGTGVLGQEPPP